MTSPVLIDRFDHMVLTVADIDETCDFYRRVLGMEKAVFAGGRVALGFGRQKSTCIRPRTPIPPGPRTR